MQDIVNIVTIGLGVNDKYLNIADSKIQTNLEGIIARLNKYSPGAKIFLLTPSTVAKGANPVGNMQDSALATVRTLYDTIAAEFNNVFVVHTENGWDQTGCAANTYDGLHSNAAGHQVIFNILQPIVLANAGDWLKGLGVSI